MEETAIAEARSRGEALAPGDLLDLLSREKAGFNVEDRITLGYAGKEKVFEKFGDEIAKKVLATSVTAGDLADAEYDFRRSSELKPHQTQKKFPPWNLTHLPVWNRPHQEEIIYEAVHRNAMQRWLPEAGIDYLWKGDILGGFAAIPDSAIEWLAGFGSNRFVCIMCMEADPEKCHRKTEIARRLPALGVTVEHIVS